MSKFIVTRQSYWHEGGALGVEIALGDSETWNPGALASRYNDDFFESDDPREIVKAAIRLRTYWRQDLTSDEPIAFTFSFNDLCYPGLEEGDTIYDLSRWAEQKWAEMPKCDQCGGLGDDWYRVDDPDEGQFCSDHCADEYFLARHKELDASECEHRDDCIFHDPPDIATCGSCGLSWDDAIPTSWTPVPSGRCPFEYQHKYDANDEPLLLEKTDIPPDFPVRPIDPEESD